MGEISPKPTKQLNMYDAVIRKLEPQKVYTYAEMLKAICPTQSSTASYILNDLVCAGRIVQVLHPVLNLNGYRLKQ